MLADLIFKATEVNGHIYNLDVSAYKDSDHPFKPGVCT